MSQGPKAAKRLWIILVQDGRHVTVGRAAPPSDAQIAAAAAALTAQGLAGWLATLDGNYWWHRCVTPAPVQILAIRSIVNILDSAAQMLDGRIILDGNFWALLTLGTWELLHAFCTSASYPIVTAFHGARITPQPRSSLG